MSTDEHVARTTASVVRVFSAPRYSYHIRIRVLDGTLGRSTIKPQHPLCSSVLAPTRRRQVG